MSPPTTVDEIPWDGPDGPPGDRLVAGHYARCKHLARTRAADSAVETCDRCGHVFDPARQRAGRRSRDRGKRQELDDARALGLERRGTNSDPEDSGGVLDPVVAQSKTGPAYYPTPIARELEALAGVAQGRPRLVVTTDKPGPGIKRRPIVSLYRDEFSELVGLDARRAVLEEVAQSARELLIRLGDVEGPELERMAAYLVQLDQTATRRRRP